MQRPTQLRQDPWDQPVPVEGRERHSVDQHVLPKMHMSPRQQQRSCSFNEGHSRQNNLKKQSSTSRSTDKSNFRRSTQSHSFYDKNSRSSSASITNISPSPRKIPQTRRIPPTRRSMTGGLAPPQVYPDLNITPQQFNDAKAKAEAHRQQRQKRWASASNNISNKSNGSDTAKKSDASGRAEITSPTVERTLSSSLSALSIDIPDCVAVVPGQQSEGSLLSIESDTSGLSKSQYSPPAPIPKQLSPPAPPLTRKHHSPPPPAPKSHGYNKPLSPRAPPSRMSRQHSPPPPSRRQHSPPPTAKQLGYNRQHNPAPRQPSRSPPPPTASQLGYNEPSSSDNHNHRTTNNSVAKSAVPSALDKNSVKRLAMQHRRSFCVPDRDRASFLAGRRPSVSTNADPPTITPPVSPTPRQHPGRVPPSARRSFCVPSRRHGSVSLGSDFTTRNTPPSNPDPATITNRRPSVVSTTSHSNSSSNFSRGSSDPPAQPPRLLDSSSNDPPSRSGMLVTIFPGCRVPLRGSDETRKAVATDFYTTTTCFGCASEILCVSNVRYTMCPHCRVISPLDGDTFEGEPRWGLGLGFTQNGLWDMQAEIAAQRFGGY